MLRDRNSGSNAKERPDNFEKVLHDAAREKCMIGNFRKTNKDACFALANWNPKHAQDVNSNRHKNSI
jgi:hypothetical protein